VPSIRVSTVLSAPPRQVWADVSDIASHVEWMGDADEIRFTSPQHEGVGTTFDCDTRIGPFTVTDRMAITAWDEPANDGEAAMGVRHDGVITGSGRFTLRPEGTAGTRFTWEEDLTFAWWLAGPAGAAVARPALRGVWRRNLARLQARFA